MFSGILPSAYPSFVGTKAFFIFFNLDFQSHTKMNIATNLLSVNYQTEAAFIAHLDGITCAPWANILERVVELKQYKWVSIANKMSISF